MARAERQARSGCSPRAVPCTSAVVLETTSSVALSAQRTRNSASHSAAIALRLSLSLTGLVTQGMATAGPP